jgi:hypothetical protein
MIAEGVMASRARLLMAVPIAAGLLAMPMAAHADWHGRGGWHGGGGGWHGGGWHGGGWGYRPHYGPGPAIAGALLGLGVGAVVAGALAPPPVYYAPPPVYYAPPPVYYAPPPAYYPPPVYYGR